MTFGERPAEILAKRSGAGTPHERIELELGFESDLVVRCDLAYGRRNREKVSIRGELGTLRLENPTTQPFDSTFVVRSGEATVINSVLTPVEVAEPLPAPPASDAVSVAIGSYVDALQQGDTESVTQLFAGANSEQLDELIQLMGENRFQAELASAEDATLEGDVATASFAVDASYRSFIGSSRERTLSFEARFQLSGTVWSLFSVVLLPE